MPEVILPLQVLPGSDCAKCSANGEAVTVRPSEHRQGCPAPIARRRPCRREIMRPRCQMALPGLGFRQAVGKSRTHSGIGVQRSGEIALSHLNVADLLGATRPASRCQSEFTASDFASWSNIARVPAGRSRERCGEVTLRPLRIADLPQRRWRLIALPAGVGGIGLRQAGR